MPLNITSLSLTLSVSPWCNKVRNSKSLIGLLSIACKYRTLSTFCQSITFCRRFFKIMSSQIRVARPLPSMNGCATFISTYFAMISSNVVSGIFSITGSITPRYIQLAKRKFPFAMFKVRIFPANSYKPSGKSSVSCPLKPSDSAPLKHSTMPP